MTLFLDNPDLLPAFRRGTTSVLKAVYLGYGNSVYSIIKNGFAFRSDGRASRWSGSRSEHDAEELLQEVFRKAFEEHARVNYDGIRPYRDYLSSIARHHIIDELRRKRPRLFATEEESRRAQESVADPLAQNPEEQAEQQQLRRLVEAFYASLAPLERNVVDRRFAQELEQEATSELLGISVYRVRKLEHGIRRRLFRDLRQHGLLSDAPAERPAAGKKVLP